MTSTWMTLCDHVHQRIVKEAVDRVPRSGREATDGRVVAELPFGFWVGMLGPGRNYEIVLWRPVIRHAFKGYRGTRKQLHLDLDRLRTL